MLVNLVVGMKTLECSRLARPGWCDSHWRSFRSNKWTTNEQQM